MTGATGPALLPKAFLAGLGDTPPRDDAVKLGKLEAYRYQGLRPEGYKGGLTLYVAPTTEGVATVACASTASEAADFLPACEQVAGGLALTEGQAFPLGPDEKYLATLDKTINTLNASRKSTWERCARRRAVGPGEGRRRAGRGLSQGAEVAPGPVSESSGSSRERIGPTRAQEDRVGVRAACQSRTSWQQGRVRCRQERCEGRRARPRAGTEAGRRGQQLSGSALLPPVTLG